MANLKSASLLSLCVISLLGMAIPLDAGLLATIEDPGIQTHQATLSSDFVVLDFNGLAGTIESQRVFAVPGGNATLSANTGNLNYSTADQFGGAENALNNTTDYLAGPSDFYTLEISTPADYQYLGFWYSAGDETNQIEFFNDGNLIASFSTQTILDSGKLQGTPNTGGVSGHFGNPTDDFLGQNDGEPYAFVNFFFDDGVVFDEIDFIGGNFELDNLTFAQSFDDTSGDIVSPVPEPASMLLLGLTAMGGFAYRTRQRRTGLSS